MSDEDFVVIVLPRANAEGLSQNYQITEETRQACRDALATPPKSRVACPECRHNLDDVITSLIRQRGRFKAQRNDARKKLAAAHTNQENKTDDK